MEISSLNVIMFIIIIVVNPVKSIVADWGEECEYTAECGDHRLVCEEVKIEGNGSKVCVCDRYHKWNGNATGCVRIISISDILSMIQQKYNISSHIENEANLVFIAQISAGLLVMAIGFSCTVIVFGYCYFMWNQDSKLERRVRDLEAQKNQPKPRPSQGVT